MTHPETACKNSISLALLYINIIRPAFLKLKIMSEPDSVHPITPAPCLNTSTIQLFTVNSAFISGPSDIICIQMKMEWNGVFRWSF